MEERACTCSSCRLQGRGDPLAKFAGPTAQWRVKTWLSMGTESALLELAPCLLNFSECRPVLVDNETFT